MAGARATDVKHERPGTAAASVHRPATNTQPGLAWHPCPKQEARFSQGTSTEEDVDMYMLEQVDFEFCRARGCIQE